MLTERVAAFAELGRVWESLKRQGVSFAEPIAIFDRSVLSDLQNLLAQETGRLDRLFDVTLDDSDTFRGKAEQRITLGRSQFYRFTIAPEQMSYKLDSKAENFGETDEDWIEILDYATKTGKKLNCKPGNMQCGGKCQNGKMNCYVDMTPAQKKAAQAAVRKARATAKKTSQAEAYLSFQNTGRSFVSGMDFTLEADVQEHVKKQSALVGLYLKAFEVDRTRLFPKQLAENNALREEHDRLDLESRRTDDQLKERMNRVRQALLDASPMSEAESIKLAGRIKISKAAAEEHGESRIREAMADFHRLTNGVTASNIKKIDYDDVRAYALVKSGRVNVGFRYNDSHTKDALFHESGHHLEFLRPDANAAVQGWLRSRAEGDRPQKLSKLTGDPEYGDDEVAWKDNFSHPYVGKFYKNRMTEVVSMGLERFAAEGGMRELMSKDADHFYMMVGLLNTLQGR